MRQAIRGPFWAVSLLLFAGCAGEPFQLSERASDGEPPSPAGAAARAPSRAEQLRRPTRTPELPLAAATRGTHGVVVFEAATGTVLLERGFAGVVIDLAWQARAERLLVVEADPGLDHARVHGCTLGKRELSCNSSSPPAWPDARVSPMGDAALFATRELGTSIGLLDVDLVPFAPWKLVTEPVSIVAAGAPEDAAALALSRSWTRAGSGREALSRWRWDGAWKVQSQEFAAIGNPESRLAQSSTSGDTWLVRKWGDIPRLAVARLDPTRPATPAFELRSAPGASGLLEEALLDTGQRAIVALLASEGAAAKLVALGLDAAARTSVIELTGGVEVGVWLGRRLALCTSGAALVATGSGLVVHRPTGTLGAPAFAQEPALTLELGPPVVALD